MVCGPIIRSWADVNKKKTVTVLLRIRSCSGNLSWTAFRICGSGFFERITFTTSHKTTTATEETTTTTRTTMTEYELKKKRPGCTGMFWRSDPTGKSRLSSNDNWPRDGALLKGNTVDHKGKKWLQVTEIKQRGSQWKAAPAGAFMPFEYDDHYYLG